MRTHQLKLGAGIAAGLAAVTVALPLGSAVAGTSLPVVPTELSSRASGLASKPARIFYTGDGTGVLAGRTYRAAIGWSSWTGSQAIGTGYDLIDTCARSCAGGPTIAYPVRIEAWKPGIVHGRRVFTRLTRWYTGKRPAGTPTHYTWTDLYGDGGWGFSPPAASGYCLHTQGQPPAAGCANINALP